MGNEQGGVQNRRGPNSGAYGASAIRSSSTTDSFTSLPSNPPPTPPKPRFSQSAMRQSSSSNSGFQSLTRTLPAASTTGTQQSQPAAAAGVPMHFHKKIVGKAVRLLDDCTRAIRDQKAYALRILLKLICRYQETYFVN